VTLVRALPARHLFRVVGAACLAFALVVGLLVQGPSAQAAAATVEDDPAVQQAWQRLAIEQARAAALRTRLDEAAEAYEHANAHRIRLEDEVSGQVRVVDTARERADAADLAFARSVSASYMNPGGDAALAGAVASAPDAGTALHRAALLERITTRERLRAQQAEVVAARTLDDSQQHQVVRAGVQGVVAEAERLAEDLKAAVDEAHQTSELAERALSAARDEAQRRIDEEIRRQQEEERRRIAVAEAAAAAAHATAIAAMGSGPLPSVGGKVCPIGAPNGFIDSWGFPRSGGRQHQGVDMFAVYGMPLYAVADGVIRRVWNNRLGGLSIDLLDDDGHRYYYAHLSAASVSPGQRVRAGEVVGANGNSGNARTTPPHLHWQFHPNDGPAVNPYPLAAALCK
jgi:peptidoglycan LD-endopeptidase LytH